MDFIALFVSLPAKAATARMRVWRALKALGCGTLREGVYLLPDQPQLAEAFAPVVTQVRAVQGHAQVYRLTCRNADETPPLLALFDRSAAYQTLNDDIHALLLRLQNEAPDRLAADVRALHKRFDEITAIDYLPGPQQGHTRLALENLTADLAARQSPDEPHHIEAHIPLLLRAEHQARIWATRRDLWVDRVASAWLIRRHIDTSAHFLWLERPEDCPADALGFDFDGATFTHVGPRVTFETLMAAFALENDSPLQRLARLVHALDVGGASPPEAAGLEAVLRGLKSAAIDDDDFLARATPVFDALHNGFNQEQA